MSEEQHISQKGDNEYSSFQEIGEDVNYHYTLKVK
jgi:hypothetical protein